MTPSIKARPKRRKAITKRLNGAVNALKAGWSVLSARDIEFFGGLLVAAAGGVTKSIGWTCILVGAALALHAALAPLLAGAGVRQETE